jgi:hypothetical protein
MYQKIIKYLVFVILTSFVCKTFSQSHKLGMHAGGSISNVYHTSAFFAETDYKQGILAGINYHLNFENKLALMFDLIYVQKGFHYDFEYESYHDDLSPYSGTSEYKFAYEYIRFPVSIGYTLGNKFAITPYAGMAGAKLSRAYHKYWLYDENSILIHEGIEDKKALLPKYDWSVHGGLYFEYFVKDYLSVFSNVQFFYSFSKFSNLQYFTESELRHYGGSLSLGVFVLVSNSNDN